MANEYQLRLKDMNYNEKINQLTEKFSLEMDTVKTHANLVATQKDREEAHHDQEVGELMDAYVSLVLLERQRFFFFFFP